MRALGRESVEEFVEAFIQLFYSCHGWDGSRGVGT